MQCQRRPNELAAELGVWLGDLLREEAAFNFLSAQTAATTDAQPGYGRVMIEIERLIDDWLAAYDDMCRHTPNVLSFDDHGLTFLFDLASPQNPNAEDRLVAAYGLSSLAPARRDAVRIRGFLGGGIDIVDKGRYDKGHALAHAIGGGLDANLFPQRPDLNQGISKQGKLFRSMERYAGAHAGTFVYSRLIYGDDSWVPCALEYGVQREDGSLWVERFDNT